MYQTNEKFDIAITEDEKDIVLVPYHEYNMRLAVIKFMNDNAERFDKDTMKNLYAELLPYSIKYEDAKSKLMNEVIYAKKPELKSVQKFDWNMDFYANVINITIQNP